MVVKNALIVLKFFMFGGPVAAYRYTSFDEPANTVEIRLPSLLNDTDGLN